MTHEEAAADIRKDLETFAKNDIGPKPYHVFTTEAVRSLLDGYDKLTTIKKSYSARIDALSLVDAERDQQDAKWGEQNHEPSVWVGILGEEFGEYCEAVNETVFDNGPREHEKGGKENMMRELTHVAAVAVAAIECLMRSAEKAPEPGGEG